jgi:hypothetical protein
MLLQVTCDAIRFRLPTNLNLIIAPVIAPYFLRLLSAGNADANDGGNIPLVRESCQRIIL